MELKFTVHTKIQKPISEVFEAVYNPDKLSQFFTTGGSSGPLDEGSTVTWAWHDYPGTYPVDVVKMVPNSLIALEWATTSGGYSTLTEIAFEELSPAETLVKITESGWKADEQGLKDSYGNCYGWTEVLCCMKAWLEYGINLRKGAHEGMYESAKKKVI
jgi:uncharacterized protein YndB with AHSA1/START domain